MPINFRYRVMDTINKFETNYTKKLLIGKGAVDHLALRLEKISVEEHYARL